MQDNIEVKRKGLEREGGINENEIELVSQQENNFVTNKKQATEKM